MARSVLRAASACALLAGVTGQWVNRLTDNLVDDGDKATVAQLIAEGGGISAESCGGLDDALQVDHVQVLPNTLAVSVRGTLARPLSGGIVRARLSLRKPVGMSIGQHFKYLTATSFTRARKFSEPLCQHLGLSASNGTLGSCIIPAGAQELRFAFKDLPKMVFVGTYDLEVHATDEAEHPIACIQGQVAVQPGKSKGMLRKLETSGCPALITENFGVVNSFYTQDDCGNAGKRWNLNFDMKNEAEFRLQGHWMNFDRCGGDSSRLWLAKRHLLVYEPCDAEQKCEHVSCAARCEWCDGCGDDGQFRCVPENEASDCEESQEYDISPEAVEANCKDGAPAMVSSAAAPLPAPVVLFMGLAFATLRQG